MSQLKTVENDHDPYEFLKGITHARRREDTKQVLAIMERVTQEPPKMWGQSIIGFGKYSYRRSDNSVHQWMMTGLSPRKQALTVYIMPGFSEFENLLAKLGQHTHSVSCLYIRNLENIDLSILEELIKQGYQLMQERYGSVTD